MGGKPPNIGVSDYLCKKKYRTVKLENNEVGYLQGFGGEGMEWSERDIGRSNNSPNTSFSTVLAFGSVVMFLEFKKLN